MPQPKIVLTRRIPDAGMDLILERFRPEIWMNELPPGRGELLGMVRSCEGLLCLLTDHVDGEVMDAAGSGLKVISTMSVGVDHIDVQEATRRGIPVGNTPGVLTEATADHTFALMLAAARRIPEAERFLRAGKWVTWSPNLLLGVDLWGATLGIVGFGRIGQAVARRAGGFNMKVLCCSPHEVADADARKVDLDTLLGESDIVSMHVPLTSSTRHMVDARFLSKMKPTAILVNTSRGGVVDQTALHEALKSGRIFASALDVTEPEPVSMDNPLLKLENCVIVPHLGSASKATRDNMAMMAAHNLIAGISGLPLPDCVNREVYKPTS